MHMLHRIPSPESADIELMVLADYVSESVEDLQRRVEVGSAKGGGGRVGCTSEAHYSSVTPNWVS